MTGWTFHDLRKTFAGRTLFEIGQLRLDAGHAYVLTGVNGAGKTTLLRMLGGLEPAPGASVMHEGRSSPLAPYPPALRRRVVYVHQHPYLFGSSVRDNLAYPLRVRAGLSGAEAEARIDAAIEWAGVGAAIDVAPARLSGGEQQRVALARARLLDPSLLLLDEPTSHLDGDAREKVLALIETLRGEGRTVLVVCHDRDVINLDAVSRIKLADGTLHFR